MVNPIPGSVRKLWDAWNIRGVILLSLSVQVILCLFAPLRKGTRSKLVIMMLWSVYLLADLAAIFALGLISNNQEDTPDISPPAENTDLLAFWPPFLILHLGGPDNITAFALEDNELWLRHFVGFLLQVVAAVYIFLLSLPKTRLAVPTILMFIAASIRYLERTRAFYLASFDRFRDSLPAEPDSGPNYARLMEEHISKGGVRRPTAEPDWRPNCAGRMAKHISKGEVRRPTAEPDSGPNYARLMEEYTSWVEERRPTAEIITAAEIPSVQICEYADDTSRLNNLEVVSHAYHYFQIFKGIIVDHIFSFAEHQQSRGLFLNITPEDAFKIIEVELNLIYEVLYTKIQVVYSRLGCINRFISFCLVVTAFSIFHFKVKSHGFEDFDVAITYALFLGAIALDIMSLFIFLSFDLIIGTLKNSVRSSSFVSKFKSYITALLSWILNLKKPRWYECDDHFVEGKHLVLATPFLFGRWAGHFSGLNLLKYCLKRRPTRVHKVKSCLHRGFDKVIHSLKVDQFVRVMTIAIFKFSHLSRVDKLLHFLGLLNDKIICILGLIDFVDGIRYVSHEPLTKEVWDFIINELREKSQFANNAETVMKISSARGEWILKDRRYCSKLMPYLTEVTYDESLLLWHTATEFLYQTAGEDTGFYRAFSKLLSDYMLYLLIIHPTMISTVTGIAKTRFRDTCAETMKFLKRRGLEANQEIKKVCNMILAVDTYIKPVRVKGDRSKSVLFDAIMLAKELKTLSVLEEWEGEDKWKLMSKVWVELLSYAAAHSSGRAHAQQISNGGELITFVWLLMTHFGLRQQFLTKVGVQRAQSIVGE